MPSSVMLGSRPRIFWMRAYSSAVTPCSAAISGVTLISMLAVAIEILCFNPSGGSISAFDPLLQNHFDRLAGFLADRFLDVRPDWQLMPAVAQRHEGAAEGPPASLSANLDQATGAEKPNRLRPDQVSPAALVRAPLQFGGKGCLQLRHCSGRGLRRAHQRLRHGLENHQPIR